MSPSEVSDLQLIKSIKEQNDSNSLLTLVDRVTGLYISTVSSYTYVPILERQDLIEHKTLNIYDFAKTYNPNRGMAFSTYVAQMTKWKCLRLINKFTGEKEELSENIVDESGENSEEVAEKIDMQSFIFQCADHVDDKRFLDILKLRYGGSVRMTWKEIGEKMNLSHETVRQIFKRNFEFLKKRIINK